jgi:hypothetical protein
MLLREWDREQREDPGPDQLYNNYVDYWGGLQQSYKDRYTYEESEKRKKQEQDEKEKENRPGIIEPNPVTTFLAQLLSLLYPNAAAVFVDIGGTLVGGEMDGGGFLVLVGNDAGAIALFTEDAGGGSIDASFGPEIGSIYIGYSPDEFEVNDLYGDRYKIWAGIGEVIVGQISLSRSYVRDKGFLYGVAKQVGFGGDLGFSAGFNFGQISSTRNLLWYLFNK